MLHIHTDRHTDRQTDRLINNGTLYAPWYEEAFLPEGIKRSRSLRSLGLALLWRGFFAYRQKNGLIMKRLFFPIGKNGPGLAPLKKRCLLYCKKNRF